MSGQSSSEANKVSLDSMEELRGDDRLSRISTQTNLVLDEHTSDTERTKLYFKYVIAFDGFLRQKLKQDPPPADISEEIWKKFMKMKFQHRGPGSFRSYLFTVLNSSIATYQSRRQKVVVSDTLEIEVAKDPQQGVTENVDYYATRLKDFFKYLPEESVKGTFASELDIKSIVRSVLQAISWERLNQIEEESRKLDKEAKASGRKRGDSRWRYILAAKTCAQLRIDCDRSTADVEKLVQILSNLVGQSSLSGNLAKQWASRGSRIYADVMVECAAEMFDTQDLDSLTAEFSDLSLLNIKFIADSLKKKDTPEE